MGNQREINQIYIEKLRTVEDYVYKNMDKVGQITIDLIQEINCDLDRDYQDEPIKDDELGSFAYEASNILLVIDKSRNIDIKALEDIKAILDDWSKQLKIIG